MSTTRVTRGRVAVAVAAAVSLVVLVTGRSEGHEIAASRYNYHDDIRPLFLKHCGGCHHDGGPTPMSLLDYQQAVPWANAIKLQVLQGTMPPFLPDDENGPFAHRRGLTAEEIDMIVDWTVGATPEGEPAEAESSGPANRWSEGKPDLVLEPKESVVLGEDESEKRACVVLPTGLDHPRVLSGLDLAPGTPTLVRRATVRLGDSCSNGEPLLTWLPDQAKSSFPAGTGRELAPGATVALEIAYKKGWGQEGKRIADKSALGLWFASGDAALGSMRIESGRTLASSMKLVSLYPDLSSASDEPLRVEAVLPGGKTQVLLSIASPDPAWMEKYFFRSPLSLPRGTELRISRPSVWADFLTAAPAAGSEDEAGSGHRSPR